MDNFLIVFLTFYIVDVLAVLVSHFFAGQSLTGFDFYADKRVETWKKIWNETLINSNGVIKKKYIRMIRKPYQLVALKNFLSGLDEDNRCKVLECNSELMIKYVKKLNVSMKAYFAYLLGQVEYSDQFNKQTLCEHMVQFTTENSVHLRENALKALYHLGDVRYIKRAFVELSKLDITHSEKLVADDMVDIIGYSDELAKEIMSVFAELDECYKTAFINYLVYVGCNTYNNEFKEMIEDKSLPTDARCAIIRLLGKDTSADNGVFLANYVRNHDVNEAWESMAVSVGVLGQYKRTELIYSTLVNSIRSSNWYIRMNAAKALCKIGISKEEQNEIENGNDKYAKDALNYALMRG